MLSSWQDVTALLGAVGIAIGGLVGVLHAKRTDTTPIENTHLAKKVAVLEEFKKNQETTNQRLQATVDEQRRRHDEVVDGIYTAIADVRKLFIDFIREFRKEKP